MTTEPIRTGQAAAGELKKAKRRRSVKIKPRTLPENDERIKIESKINNENAVQKFEAGGESFVDELIGYVKTFLEICNDLSDEIGEDDLQDKFREALYKPVALEQPHESARHVCLYEIGAARSPNDREAGRLSLNEKKFKAAVSGRMRDFETLFFSEGDGLLYRIGFVLSERSQASHIWNETEERLSALRKEMRGAFAVRRTEND